MFQIYKILSASFFEMEGSSWLLAVGRWLNAAIGC
jgi:hypothetical protein